MQTGYRFLEPDALARVKNLSVVARGVVEGFISGLHSSPYKGFSVEFAEHREYTAGDDPRHLDSQFVNRPAFALVDLCREGPRLEVLHPASLDGEYLPCNGAEIAGEISGDGRHVGGVPGVEHP